MGPSVESFTQHLRTSLLIVGVLMVSAPAAADNMADELIGKAVFIGVVAIVGLITSSVVFVFFFSRLLGLEGGVLAAFLSVLLGMLAAIGIAVVASFMMIVLPKELFTAIGAGAGILGGGVGVKVLFKTDIAHGMLVYLLATTCTYLVLGLTLIVLF